MKLRSALYLAAKGLGDVQAAQKALEKRSAKPVVDRVRRRLIGRLLSRLIR